MNSLRKQLTLYKNGLIYFIFIIKTAYTEAIYQHECYKPLILLIQAKP